MSVVVSQDSLAAPGVLHLASGGDLPLRFAQPRDAAPLRAFFSNLSERSRYNRFLGATSELPQSLLDQFTHAGEDDRFEIVATAMIGGRETIIAEARYAFDRSAGTVEFGLSVDDRWQGHGVGQALLADLEDRAAVLGASRLFGETLRTNAAMIGAARKSGFTVMSFPADWRLVHIEKSIDGSPGDHHCEVWRLAAADASRDASRPH